MVKIRLHPTLVICVELKSLLYGLPDTLLCKLQRVQNAAARLITRTQRRDHITPVLMELHWLPVEQRLTYKILLYTFKATKGDAPSYIGDLLEVHQPTRNLRSNARSLLVVPKTRTVTYGDRSFSSAAANLWNDIPESMKNANSIDIFKRQLKTRLFTQAFKDYLWVFVIDFPLFGILINSFWNVIWIVWFHNV